MIGLAAGRDHPHQGPRRRRDRGLPRPAARRGTFRWCCGDPPHARLRRGNEGDHPEVRGARLSRRLPEPLQPRGAGRLLLTTPQPSARALGGVPDERLVGDVQAASRLLTSLESSNGRVATIGYCSGGRQSFLAACSLPLDAAVDCYGAFVVGTPPESSPLRVCPIVHMTQGPLLSFARPVRRR